MFNVLYPGDDALTAQGKDVVPDLAIDGSAWGNPSPSMGVI
jgi:hypothetical protein